MAIIKTYPLKNNYYGPDRLILSDMQPDSEGNVSGDTRNLTLSSLKSFIGTGSDAFTLTTTGTSGAATFNTNTKILNIPDYSVGNVDGSGTASYMAKWTDSNTIGIGAIYDNAGNIGIGTTSPNYKLDVDGDLSAKGITSSTTHTVTIEATAGWYRIMQWSGPSRGGATVKLSTTGGSVAPTTYVINAYKTYGDPASTNTLKLEQYGNSVYITKARIATDSVTSITYVEIYNTFTTANYTMEVYHDSLLGLDSLTSVLTGTLQTGPNSVSQDELPFQIEGTTTEKSSSELVTLIGDGTNDGKLRFNCSANSHYVEVVGPTHSGGSSYSLKLPNSLPSVSNQILESNGAGALSWIPTPTGGGGGGGTVTSVGITMPPAFSVSNSPITGSGNISVGVTGGTAGEFLAYNGQWATPTDNNTNVANSNLQLDNNRTLDLSNGGAADYGLTFISTLGGVSKNLFKFDQIAGTSPRFTVGHTESAYEGYIVLEGNGSNRTGILQFENAAGTYYTSIKAPTTFGANQNIAYTLPNLQGSANSVLTNNGSGTLSWTTTSEPTEITSSTAVNSTTFANTPFTFANTNAGSGVGAPVAVQVGSQYGNKHISFYLGTTFSGAINQAGSNTVNYATSSDYRLKENVVEMTGAVNRVKQLNPSRFNFIADGPSRTVDGFLAHEVSNIVPEAITGSKDAVDAEGNIIPQGIDQSKLVPLLVGAIKELTARIEALEA